MEATGLFFLRARAFARRLPDGAFACMEMSVVERDPADPKAYLNELTVRWPGPLASEFLHRHDAELKPGRGVVLKLSRLRGDAQYGWMATATHCELAELPPSWKAHESTTGQPATT